jgi:hypothetical protein
LRLNGLNSSAEKRAGQPGIRLLLSVLDQHTFRLSDDELELLFRPLAVEAGLPSPETKQMLNDFEVDFFSHWQVKYEPEHVIDVLRATASRLPRPEPA